MASGEVGTSTAPSQVNIVVGNINGRLSKGRGTRRELIISNVIEASSSKPDFLAFQDGVCRIDVESFVAALNERWPGSSYWDVPVPGPAQGKPVGKKAQPFSSYAKNKEALLYDTKLWKRLVEFEGLFYKACTDTSRAALSARARLGMFGQTSSRSQLVVVSYHGQQRKGKRNEEKTEEYKVSIKEKEVQFQSNFPHITDIGR
jgi:hypothetical protein